MRPLWRQAARLTGRAKIERFRPIEDRAVSRVPENSPESSPEQAPAAAAIEQPRARLLELAGGAAGSRLARAIDFLIEIDRLKSVLRRTLLADGSRRENSAEHSWHLCLFALVLAEHSGAEIDLTRVLKMLLVHDIVEVDAGDTFCYDEDALSGKDERERRAALRIFGLLPDDVGLELRLLWEEFEQRTTPEARFANAVDRLQPMLHNLLTRGHSWREHGVGKHQVLERNAPIDDGAPDLWRFAEAFLDEAEEAGWFGE
ncbi:MAG: HD domain-containing protein [Acidobacteria bacterium]|nr:MAG: HD domain-containing protein [Acidobacteriota bacterium]REK05574.1 MAG: HD domain-containing protein [Acidobacteriota bacterium]